MTALLQGRKQAKKQIEKKGRKGDKVLAHLMVGEVVVPRALAEDEEFRTLLTQFFKESNVDIEEFIVGSGKNKINPKTGYMEFWKNPLYETPKPSLEQSIAQSVSRQGLTKTTQYWTFMKKHGGSMGGIPGKALPKLAPRVLDILKSYPSPPTTIVQISEQAQRAGEAERRRLRGRRGRLSTIFAGRRQLGPAITSQTGLKTTLG